MSVLSTISDWSCTYNEYCNMIRMSLSEPHTVHAHVNECLNVQYTLYAVVDLLS